MAESDTHTQRAAEALESAGFEKAKAQAIVTTAAAVTDDGIAAIAGNLATKDQVEALATRLDIDTRATREQVEALTKRMEVEAKATREQVEALAKRMEVEARTTREQVEALSSRMEVEARATKERLAATATKEELTSATAKIRAEIAVEFKELYRHLWVMSAGIVGLTVTLVKLIP